MKWASSYPLRRLPSLASLALVFGVLVLLAVPAQANPQPVTGACCFPCAPCQVLFAYDCEQQGGVYYGDFTTCDPSPCSPPPTVCCYPDGSCAVVDCMTGCGDGFAMPGQWCDPNPCPVPTGACCSFVGICQILSQAACIEVWGGWMGPDVTSCSPNPCPDCKVPCSSDACCLPDGQCLLAWRSACEGHGGVWQGSASTCSPSPCATSGLPEPKLESRTWGQLKSHFR